ncbi:hypothetical protein AVEN_7142-1 [Araneus ventricosus]|uniref:Tc1-like transposase DDE domain-containing protein n=1 Tax=Araneus ventricosus TaxID=182803 RepID=A0A4Y2SVP9_ARAVE|nr:hypothetical protein AVEN_7142-1 [Araneus ventricosus]
MIAAQSRQSSCPTARIVKPWLKEHEDEITHLSWSTQYSNLNIIELLWFLLEQRIRICFLISTELFTRGIGGIVVRSRPQGRRVPRSKPDSSEESPCIWTQPTLNLTSWVTRPPAAVVKKFGEGDAGSHDDTVICLQLKITRPVPK